MGILRFSLDIVSCRWRLEVEHLSLPALQLQELAPFGTRQIVLRDEAAPPSCHSTICIPGIKAAISESTQN